MALIHVHQALIRKRCAQQGCLFSYYLGFIRQINSPNTNWGLLTITIPFV